MNPIPQQRLADLFYVIQLPKAIREMRKCPCGKARGNCTALSGGCKERKKQ